MKIIIYPFPATDKNNPFLDLFYREVNLKTRDDFEFEVKTCSLGELVKEGVSDGQQKSIIHIHWSTQLYGSRYILKSLYLMVVNFSRLFILKKKYSFKIVWTMHNYKSHDYPHPIIDWLGRKILFSFADCIIVQQQTAQKVMADKHKNKNIVFIPLGNYIGVYGEETKTRSEMRKEFGFGEDDLVLLSFGMVRPYKKNDEIIKVLKQNSGAIDDKIKLLIIGPTTDTYAEKIKALIGDNHHIVFKNSFIEDKDVANLFSMADYSIFWFDESVLTSSGIVLSLSYGTPVIARGMPASELIKDGKNGFIYIGEDGLVSIFNKLETGKSDREEIINSVRGLSWDYVAGKLTKEFIRI